MIKSIFKKENISSIYNNQIKNEINILKTKNIFSIDYIPIMVVEKTGMGKSTVYFPPRRLIFIVNNKNNQIYASCSSSEEIPLNSLKILKTNCFISLIPSLSLFLALKSLL